MLVHVMSDQLWSEADSYRLPLYTTIREIFRVPSRCGKSKTDIAHYSSPKLSHDIIGISGR